LVILSSSLSVELQAQVSAIIIPEMQTINEQVAQIEAVLRKTPHHKATNAFIGAMRAKIARLKDRQIELGGKHGGGGAGFQVKKQGDATVVLVGPPSCGKSTLINILTNAESKVAPYAFTTVTVVPGMLKYRQAYIQILDIPGLIEGASRGKGRGREVLSVARAANLLIVMTDVERVNLIPKMIQELEAAGIRLNKEKPNIIVERKTEGGIEVKSNIKQDLDKETIKEIAREYGIKNGIITLKDSVTLEQLFDSFSENRVYIPAIFVVNKIDEKPKGYKYGQYIGISAEKEIGIQNLINSIWRELKFVTVYLVKPDEELSEGDPVIMKEGENLHDVALKIGPDFAASKKIVKIWGTGAKFGGQEVSFSNNVQEGMKIRFL
jgi:small GTP-binding protein